MNLITSISLIVIVFLICSTIIIVNWRNKSLEDKVTKAEQAMKDAKNNEYTFRNLYYDRADDFSNLLNSNTILVTKETFEELKSLFDEMQKENTKK